MTQTIMNMDLTGGAVKLSPRAQQYLLFQSSRKNGRADIVIVCPENLDGFVANGELKKVGDTYYFIDEVV